MIRGFIFSISISLIFFSAFAVGSGDPVVGETLLGGAAAAGSQGVAAAAVVNMAADNSYLTATGATAGSGTFFRRYFTFWIILVLTNNL